MGKRPFWTNDVGSEGQETSFARVELSVVMTRALVIQTLTHFVVFDIS